ncbi:uncharacterized protein K02A2.6-like [Eupeodes corollae]|uniref:uncharacterized protein K02A2.6-like n=1 Tax=Eupeodes corollae TaxID=290404 RepID=UPI0024924CAA|nr:uncharacterized protein K02A2.6-like [Eupeodes corollae]
MAQAFQAAFCVETFDKNKTKWSRWVSRLEGAFGLFHVLEAQKRDFLLHFMGSETYDILCDKLSPAQPNDKTFKDIVELLEQHFNPDPLEIVENNKFHLRKQQEGENVCEFLVNLRRLAASCNFGEYLLTALRNQFVFGLKSKVMQNRCLEQRKLTLEMALDIAKGIELSEEGGVVLGNVQDVTSAVNKITTNKSRQGLSGNGIGYSQIHPNDTNTNKNKYGSSRPIHNVRNGGNKCFRCGELHLATNCKHYNSVCSYCKKKGHLRRVCFSLNKNSDNFANYVEINENENEINQIESIFQINEITKNNDDGLFAKMYINNINVTFEVDTGSKFTIMSMENFKNIIPNKVIEKPDIVMKSFTGNNVGILGFCTVDVRYKNIMYKLKLYLTSISKHPLLGRQWVRALNINLNELAGISYNALDSNNINKINSDDTSTDDTVLIDKIKKKFPNLFETSLGKIPNFQAKLNIKANAKPVFVRHRSIPFAIREGVELEINKMVNDGILEKVNASAWATPIVPIRKTNNQIRLCGDYKVTINPCLIVDEHPLPTIEELFASISGGNKFSKIDLTKAYLQLEVNEECRDYLTLSTHKGLYRPTRLMYGISSAPAIWQRYMEELLSDIPGVSIFIDDVKITGRDNEEHLDRLFQVLSRLDKNNMRINVNKCQFFQDKIEYVGYEIDKNGIHKTKNKIEAIDQMPVPENKDQVRSYVGLVNYYGRFFKNLSTTLYPINDLLKKNVPFVWNKSCQTAFDKIKMEMQTDNFLTHYNPKLKLLLATDASPYGVGAVLSHEFPDGTEKPIMYASQTLTPTQQKYSQIDKEAYAITYGVKRFYQYVYGRKFTLVTDNKPVSQIFSPKKGMPVLSATRMQHYAAYLQCFDYDIVFRRTEDHCNADAMSRLPIKKISKFTMDEADVLEISQIENLPLTVDELGKATINNDNVKVLVQGLRTGRIVEPKYRFGIDQNEFTLQQNCIMRGMRVFIPETLRKRVLSELHASHFGATRMKSLARSYCWWERIDSDIEDLVKNCPDCQRIRSNPPKTSVHCWEAPTEPFQRVHIDFAGPFLGKLFFILVDAYSKWPEVFVIPNMTTDTTITTCRNIFSRFGIPSVLVSDHGVQFTNYKFKEFLKMNGIVHKMGAPYHPATNGQAERYVQTIKQKLKTLGPDTTDLNTELCRILLDYRKMVHPATGKSPSMMVFGREIRSRIDCMIPFRCFNSIEAKRGRSLEENDRVAVREYLDRGVKWRFGQIIRKLGLLHYLVRLDDNRIWKRHIDQIRQIGIDVKNQQTYDVSREEHPPSLNIQQHDNGGDMLTDTETSDNNISMNNEKNHQNCTAGEGINDDSNCNQNKNVIKILRRSNRIIKAPDRLDI